MLAPHAETLNWRALFNNLLRNTSFELRTEQNPKDQKTKLVVTFEETKDVSAVRLRHLLSTQENFDNAQCYSIQGQVQKSNAPRIIPVPPDTKEAGKDILLKLIGKSAFEEFCIDINMLFGDAASSNNRVLYSVTTPHKRVIDSWNAAVQQWVTYFRDVDASRVQAAWLDGKVLDTPSGDLGKLVKEEQGIVSGLIQQCFGVVIDENSGHGKIFFNFGLLHQYVSAPDIEITKLPSGKVQIEIDREHLLATMQVYTRNRMLLRVYQEQSKAIQAKVLTFALKPTVAKTLMHILIVDRSGSMEKYYEKLKEQLKIVINNLRDIDDSAIIRLVFFSEGKNVICQFAIKDAKAIEQFIDNTSSAGSTNLFGTIHDELENIRLNKINEIYNGTVILFTDGVDNTQHKTQEDVKNKIAQLNYSSSSLPKMFTVGFGDCSADVLSELARSMGNHYIHLTTIEQFNEIFDDLQTYRYQREMIDFLVKVGQTTREYRLPFYRTDKIQSPNVLIPLGTQQPTSVVFRGNELLVTLKDQIPNATIDDLLHAYLVNAKEVVVSASQDHQTKLSALRNILTQFDQLAVNHIDRNLCNDIRKEIVSIQDRLIQSAQDQRLKASLESYIRASTGALTSAQSSSGAQVSYSNNPRP